MTEQMPMLYLVQKQVGAPVNEELVGFIPEDLVPGALKNEVPALPRRFTVQVDRRSWLTIRTGRADDHALS